MAVTIQLRRDTGANWATQNPILASGEIGVNTDTNQFKLGDGVNTWSALSYGGLVGPAQTDILMGFGNGIDGDVSLSAGVTIMSRDMYYNNLTISGSARLVTNGFKIFVKNNLDLTNAPTAAIVGNNALDAASATTQTGAAGGTAVTTGTIAGAVAGGTGATGLNPEE